MIKRVAIHLGGVLFRQNNLFKVFCYFYAQETVIIMIGSACQMSISLRAVMVGEAAEASRIQLIENH
jgi:hypothetical protein